MTTETGTVARQPRLALIDTHCHLDDPAFDADRAAVLARSVEVGVTRWVNVGYKPARWTTTIELASTTSGMVHMLGLHPLDAGDWSLELQEQLRCLLQTSGAVAVGEIGLDYARGQDHAVAQRRAFAAQLELATVVGMGVVIHQRAAESDLAQLLESFLPSHPVLLHSFDAGDRLLSLALDRDYLIGVGGLATRPQATALRARLREVPLERIVLETDAPYLVPAGAGVHRNTPDRITMIAEFLAELKGVPLGEVAAVTNANACRFFGHLESVAEDVTL